MNWFKKKPKQTPRPTLPSKPVEYPTGIAVRNEVGSYYRIHSDGKRYRIPTRAILDSWLFTFVVDTTEAALKNYPIALTKIGFRDGTLLNNIADGRLYLVSAGRLRHVTSPAVLERLGATRDDAVTVSDAEINLMKQGAEIT